MRSAFAGLYLFVRVGLILERGEEDTASVCSPHILLVLQARHGTDRPQGHIT